MGKIRKLFKILVKPVVVLIKKIKIKNLVKLKIIQKNLVKLRRKKKKKTILTTSSQHEASIKPDKEGISKELSQNNVDADTTTTKNNNKSAENIVQEEKSC